MVPVKEKLHTHYGCRFTPLPDTEIKLQALYAAVLFLDSVGFPTAAFGRRKSP